MKFLYGTRRKNTPTANSGEPPAITRVRSRPPRRSPSIIPTLITPGRSRDSSNAKPSLAGPTTFAGLAAKDGHNYVGLVRNIEFPDRATWPVAIGHINDFESVKEAEQELGPILNDPSKRFLLHLSEGVDDDSRRVFHNLQRTDGSWLLSPILLGIHATGLAPNELSIMTASGGIVWSPLSNFFCMARPLMSAAPWKPGFQLRSAPTGLLVAARTCLAR